MLLSTKKNTRLTGKCAYKEGEYWKNLTVSEPGCKFCISLKIKNSVFPAQCCQLIWWGEILALLPLTAAPGPNGNGLFMQYGEMIIGLSHGLSLEFSPAEIIFTFGFMS